jgi:hypothetical protein
MERKEVIKECKILFDKIEKQQRVNSQDIGVLYYHLTGKHYKHVNCPQCIKEKVLEMRRIYNTWISEPCSDCVKPTPIEVIEPVVETIVDNTPTEECCLEHIEIPEEVIPKPKKSRKKNG